MQLERKKRYITRNGIATGPMISDIDVFRADFGSQKGVSWYPDGRYLRDGREDPMDLVAEYHEPEVGYLKITAPEAADEDILMEALRLTSGDRQQQYGPPERNLSTIAALWAAYKGVPFEARDVAAMMILVKVAREIAGPKRDTAVDIAGYARLMHLCNEAAAKQPAQ